METGGPEMRGGDTVLARHKRSVYRINHLLYLRSCSIENLGMTSCLPSLIRPMSVPRYGVEHAKRSIYGSVWNDEGVHGLKCYQELCSPILYIASSANNGDSDPEASDLGLFHVLWVR